MQLVFVTDSITTKKSRFT